MELALRALLTGSAAISSYCSSDRITWGVLGQGKGLQALVLNVVSGIGSHHYRGPDGLIRYRVQIDAYGASYLSAKELSDEVRKLLDGYKGGQILGVFLDTIRDHHEANAADRPFRVSQDFTIIWREA
ncbi:tail completion protein gp17 [Pseudogemmobacter sonorensis]|uniref:tail completion protein gp17 n=1 Tax=Pseudogemmobacter sonorensis TaxID=2989681 RepID=UPI0036C50627